MKYPIWKKDEDFRHKIGHQVLENMRQTMKGREQILVLGAVNETFRVIKKEIGIRKYRILIGEVRR